MHAHIHAPHVTALLTSLYEDAARTDPIVREQARAAKADRETDEAAYYRAINGAYLPVNPEFGRLLYGLVRSVSAKTVVEFGTSFGVSTIYLASAVRDGGGGRVITTEFEAVKTERARKNLTAAGVMDAVEFRIGDARETLAGDLPTVDFVLLDGAKSMYLDVLKLIEPKLRPGAIVASDNTDQDGVKSFLDYVRGPANGYVSSGIFTGSAFHLRGHEISVRVR